MSNNGGKEEIKTYEIAKRKTGVYVIKHLWYNGKINISSTEGRSDTLLGERVVGHRSA